MEEDQEDQGNHRQGHVDICHIEDGKVDQRKINKVHDILLADPIDKIADGSGHQDIYGQDQGKVMAILRYLPIE